MISRARYCALEPLFCASQPCWYLHHSPRGGVNARHDVGRGDPGRSSLLEHPLPWPFLHKSADRHAPMSRPFSWLHWFVSATPAGSARSPPARPFDHPAFWSWVRMHRSWRTPRVSSSECGRENSGWFSTDQREQPGNATRQREIFRLYGASPFSGPKIWVHECRLGWQRRTRRAAKGRNREQA